MHSDKISKPSQPSDKAIASSDGYCAANSAGRICIPNACFNAWPDEESSSATKAKIGPRQNTGPADPRDVVDLSKRWVGDITLPEGAFLTHTLYVVFISSNP
jgi:hypothetical protein